MTQRGYSGEVVLISPTGEIKILVLPGRTGLSAKATERWWALPEVGEASVGTRLNVNAFGYDQTQRRQAEKADKEFRRLLSAGWKVARTRRELEELLEELNPEEWKKFTDEVNGTTLTGDVTHGGSHNSGEVDHEAETPSAERVGRYRERGNRGSRNGNPQEREQKLENEERKRSKKKPMRAQVTGGGGNVIAPGPLQVSASVTKSAKASAELLEKVAGRSQFKVPRSVTTNVERLLMALETGDNPLPALQVPDERSRLRILVTPDVSGSTQSWSGVAQAWAQHLAKMPEADVIYIENSNGWFINVDQVAVEALLTEIDLVIYLGDSDGDLLCEKYAQLGATVIALDSYCASWADPQLKEIKRMGKGTLYWVHRVSAKEPGTWAKAIEMCLRHM